MGHEVGLLKSICRFEPRNLAVGLLLGCFLVTFAYFSMTNFDSFHFLVVNSAPNENAAFHNGDTVQKMASSEKLDAGPFHHESLSETIPKATTRKTKQKKENKRQAPLCDLSQIRFDKCEIEGDVRIFGRNSTIMWVPSSKSDDDLDYERKVWHIKPYPRKWDKDAMDPVRMVTVKPVTGPDEAPTCTNHSDLPAIVFSDRGYEDNYFHDFTDVLVPLFTAARRLQGEVIFLVTDLMIYRIAKYVRVYKNLTKYDLINFDCDEEIRCYKKVYIGLTSYDDFDIDPERTPERYTLLDFTKFMHTIYGLKRNVAEIPIQKTLGRKPRLLIVARGKTRRFMNLDDIVHSAEELGFEVVATEATDGLDRFSLVVNSCDAIMGVHGAGLSNMVFLPINAVFIQIVPWGNLVWVGNYFRRPVEKMKLKYLQYEITPEESTLIEQYPKNHTVFTHPASIQQKGWKALKKVFLVKQNVRLNIDRFRPTLQEALEYLNSGNL
ncbi:Glycosyltransferase family 61 protein [Rhynchospora pubera]|uniref:Glycosyltransferase family 61 protein n=1 Tax=Rhynchospora pubera TaxID=906938 RepID=A0AAV8FTH7_9POAL|nr:Glycosyltransferase family 61 protein [Rhynchospora pubera]